MTEIKRGPTDYMAETILAYIKENAELRASNAQLLSQLPEDMKHCTIQYKQCEKGHGELTATNWEQHDCLVCQVDRLNAALKGAQTKPKPRISELDVLELARAIAAVPGPEKFHGSAVQRQAHIQAILNEAFRIGDR